MDRCFVGIWPDAATADALADLPRPQQDGVRWVLPENWHITLRFLGEVRVADVVDALARVALPSTDITLGPSVSQLDERQVVIPAAGAAALQQVVDEATADIGEPRRHSFVGHLTLARVRPPATSDVLGHRFEARFRPAEIVIATSKLLPTGARYQHAATMPVADVRRDPRRDV